MDRQYSYNDVVVSSRIRLARNFKNLPFPARLRDERAFDVQKQVFDAVKPLGEFSIYQIASLDENTKGVLLEKHLISANLKNNKFSAVILSKNESISIMINEEDHIREQSFLKGFNLKLAYSKLSKIDDEILAKCDIAYSKQLGFLTACPTNLGTGIRCSCMLFLPALCLSNKIKDVASLVKNRKQTIRGFYGEGSSSSGFLYQISNQTTLGKSEWMIIDEVEKTILEICALEISERASLFKNQGEKLKQEAKNCFDRLVCGNEISINEFMRLAGVVKLYLYFDQKNKSKIEILDSLINLVQPCSLKEICGGKIEGDATDKFRGEYLKKILKNVIHF